MSMSKSKAVSSPSSMCEMANARWCKGPSRPPATRSEGHMICPVNMVQLSVRRRAVLGSGAAHAILTHVLDALLCLLFVTTQVVAVAVGVDLAALYFLVDVKVLR